MTSSRNPDEGPRGDRRRSHHGFSAYNTGRSPASLVAEACTKVLRDCGLTAADVDGICGSMPAASTVQSMLGIPEITWFANPMIPFVNQLAAAASAVHSGLCDVVLAYHGAYRMAWNTGSALKDPFRRGSLIGAGNPRQRPETVAARWATPHGRRGTCTSSACRRSTSATSPSTTGPTPQRNPAAAMRDPLTMDDYLAARMIRWPLCLLDMDVPVDGADAFVITTAGAGPRPPASAGAGARDRRSA